MFGDTLSVVSDTTIAAIMPQEADLKKKLKINTQVTGIASSITIILLLLAVNNSGALLLGILLYF